MRNDKGIGAELRRFRRSQDLTQQEMASRLGLARTTYTSYEDERAQPPANVIDQLRKMGYGTEPEVSKPQYPTPIPITLIPRGQPVPCSDWSDPLHADFEDFEEVDSYMAGKGQVRLRRHRRLDVRPSLARR